MPPERGFRVPSSPYCAYFDGAPNRETQPVPRYDGIVSLDENEVEVVIGLDPDRVHLAAGGREIGDWSTEECSIADLGDGVYSITAENVSLRFVPNDARLFVEGLNNGTGYGLLPAPDLQPVLGHRGRHTRLAPAPDVPEADRSVAPPPRALTRILFYGLAAITAAMGLWALLSIL